MIDKLYTQLLRLLIGKRPVVANVEFTGGIRISAPGGLVIGNKRL